MTRSLPEWIGKTPDTTPPPRVRARVFLSKDGHCHKCTRKIVPGDSWTLEHVKALVNGGQNRESNLDVTCEWCLPGKNAEDVAEKARVARKRGKHIGARKPKRPWSKYRKRMDGTVELREPPLDPDYDELPYGGPLQTRNIPE